MYRVYIFLKYVAYMYFICTEIRIRHIDPKCNMYCAEKNVEKMYIMPKTGSGEKEIRTMWLNIAYKIWNNNALKLWDGRMYYINIQNTSF